MSLSSIEKSRSFEIACIGLFLATVIGCGDAARRGDGAVASQKAPVVGLNLAAGKPVPAAPSRKATPPAAATAGPQKQSVWVIMKQRASLAQAQTSKDWKTRGQLVYSGLTNAAATSQAAIRSLLTSRGVAHTPYWIVNTIRVTADQATIDELAKRPDVARIVPDKVYRIPPLVPGTAQKRVQDLEWNLINIRAPEAWAQFGAEGEGIVVANIDTGVQFDHPALVRQYRGNLGSGRFDHNYNWFDPANVCGMPSSAPCDNVEHGTHTMGTMVGDDQAGNQIGVAPHARWIAAKGCETDSCSNESLLAAGQWVLAPTDLNGRNPRVDLRPHVVNNSWGGPTDEFYQETVRAWVAAGIFPAFANGNNVPGCGGASSPGNYPESYSAGAYDINNVLGFFSNLGPGIDGGIKPNIAAPGVDVRSSVPGNGYAVFSGTSMASPHVAGSVALLWSAAPALIGDIAATRALLDAAAVDTSDLSCGGTPENNNVWGQGRIDIFETVNEAPRGPAGTLVGTINTAGGEPISGAIVHVTGPADRQTSSDASGQYRLGALPEGSYSETASAFGYLSQTVTDVTIVADTTTERNFSLALAPSFALSGFVRDSAGSPIAAAQVTIANTPLDAAITDASGFYLFSSVPAGEYEITASAGGVCFTSQTSAVVLNQDRALDFTLAQHTDEFGYGCRPAPFDYIQASTVVPLSGDDSLIQLPLPFSFPFYDGVYSTINITTNGFVSFLEPNATFFNGAIPDFNSPNAAIYPFWDDLIADGSTTIRTDTLGDAPNRQFIVEWRDIAPLANTGLRMTFEVVLNENGQILTQYQSADPDPLQKGASATVGIENETSTIALQYSLNQPVLASGLAVLYASPPAGSVLGTVTDAHDGTPISGAEVRVLQSGALLRTAFTGFDGTYRLRVPVGEYTVEVAAPGYDVASAPVVVTENGVVQLDFALTSNVVRGTVTDGNGGAPISGAQVRALQGGVEVGTTFTGFDGTYVLRLPVGDYTIEASAPGYGVISQTVTLTENAVVVLDFVLTSGIVHGTVTDFNDHTPIAGAAIRALRAGTDVGSTTTAGDGTYQLRLPPGDYTLEASARGYPAETALLHLPENAFVQIDFALKTARASIAPALIQVTLPVDQTRVQRLTLTNSGAANLEFTVNESGGGRQTTVSTKSLARNPLANPNALNTRDLFQGGITPQGMAPMAPGDVLGSFSPAGLQLPWGVGFTGNLWLSDALAPFQNVEFTTLGAPTARQWPASWAISFPGDSTYVPGIHAVCQVNVGGDNGIYCWDPNTGNVTNTITGSFQWTAISQRGLAYRPDDDSFYIGGWNEGIIYHIRGLSSANPGEVIGTCFPGDGSISGLAFNQAGVLWVATNSPTDTIYGINPDDCTVLSTLPHPQPGFNGGGLDLDEAGNLWMVSQNGHQAFLLDSGVPAFVDVPWLSVAPTSGTVAPGASQALQVTLDTHGLTPGLYLATLFIQTNAVREPLLRVPVSLFVPAYQQAINVGGNAYVDSAGDSWSADRKYTTGLWGYVQKSKTASTSHSIAGTADPTLYRTQRIDPYAYRFDNVPNGTYQVEFGFAELEKVKLGDRLFDVIVEDTLVLPAHDIMYQVGRLTAENRTFFVDVADGRMDVRLVPRAGSEPPVLNALRITHRLDR